MSHFTRVQTQISNQDVLARELRSLGFSEVETHLEPQPLYGYLGDRRDVTAEVIVRRQHVGAASNDLGFRRLEDGTFELVVSEFDARPGAYDGAWLQKLQVSYARSVTMTYAEANGFVVEEQPAAQGEVRLVLRRTSF